jgi:hypothetical protein
MKIAGSPSPPPRVVVVGDDHAGANIHRARPRNTTRNAGCKPWRSRASRRRRRSPASSSCPSSGTRTATASSAVDPMDGAGSFDNPRSSWGAGSGAQGERKFSQYRDGVGPRCPWYFDPTPRDP